jgi:RNA polymerase sigma factor (sigma-70 family)
MTYRAKASNLDHKLLPEPEILKLILAHRAGDPDAAQTMIAHNERAIHRIAQRYYATGVCGDVPLEDLMQLGRMGLLRALEDYKTDNGNRFLTYAWQWIRMYISRYGEREGQKLTLSYKASERRGMLGRLRAAFEQEYFREPTTKELAVLACMPEHSVKKLSAGVLSLDILVMNGKQTLGESMPSEEPDPADMVETKLDFEQVMKRMQYLPKRSYQVMVYHFGLNGKPPLTLPAVAKKMNLSRERVRQIKEDVLKYLREDIGEE